jgi:hypothetical protein
MNINKLVKDLPITWQWITLPTTFYGWELNLTPLRCKLTKANPQRLFYVNMPHLHRISKSQLRNELKTAYKVNGEQGVLNRLKKDLVV